MRSSGDLPLFSGMPSHQEVEQFVHELEEKGYEKFQFSPQTMTDASVMGRQFLSFVRQALEAMGLINKAGVASARVAVAKMVDPAAKPETLIKELWNERARDWAVIETPLIYVVTIQTLLEFIKTNPRRKRELFLSLGSGPGLYETFLGATFLHVPETRATHITCVDVAREMTEFHKQALRSAHLPDGRAVNNVEAVTGSMTNLQFKSGTVDQIICNNALQWVPDWQKAIKEMARVMSPDGLGFLYLFVHTHPMVTLTSQGEVASMTGNFTIPELFDALEAQRFMMKNMRQMIGHPGMGQMGTDISRVFVLAQYRPKGKLPSWREMRISAALSGLSDDFQRHSMNLG